MEVLKVLAVIVGFFFLGWLSLRDEENSKKEIRDGIRHGKRPDNTTPVWVYVVVGIMIGVLGFASLAYN